MMIYDCSRTIKYDMTTYPGDSKPFLKWTKTPTCEESVSQTEIYMGMHTGTHVDSPMHFIPEGLNLDKVSLDHWIGNCRLIGIPEDSTFITKKDIEGYGLRENDIVLFKTRNSLNPEDAPFDRDYVTLDKDAAHYLVSIGVKTIGIDYLSIDGAREEGIHNIILGAGICVIESLYFKDIPVGEYFLSALPLKAETAEGSPVRAVLIKF